MVGIQITFPWGHYYAHPWGLNPVRLREAEWPPSPWRLLRALASCWFRGNPGTQPSPDAVDLIEGLGRTLPEIGFVRVSFGQTVHYQPNYGETKNGKADVVAGRLSNAEYKNTRHENHFVAVHGPVIFRWSGVSVSAAQEAILATLVADLSYFGRAESVCQATLVSGPEIEREKDVVWCVPTGGRRISELYRDVFCPSPEDFRIADLWTRRPRNGQPPVDPTNAPQHLVDTLLATDMKPDGARWTSYRMPDDWPRNRVVRTPRSARETTIPVDDGPRIARYLRFSLQCRVPLLPKFTVPLAEQFRKAACSHYCAAFGDGSSSFALFGHATDRPADVVGDHQHAFYLPTPSFGGQGDFELPGQIVDLHVWCPYGLTRAETQVLMRVQRLTWKDGRYPVRPVLTAMSNEPPDAVPLATGRVKSRVWRSETPFVPPRHFFRGDRSQPKLRHQDSPELQLIECLRKAGVNEPAEVRRIALSEMDRTPIRSIPPMPMWEIVRAPAEADEPFDGAVLSPTHCNGGDTGRYKNVQRIGFFMEVRFDREVALPMPSFGQSNHFGLGLFVPAEDDASDEIGEAAFDYGGLV